MRTLRTDGRPIAWRILTTPTQFAPRSADRANMELKAGAAPLQWFHTEFDVRDRSRAAAPTATAVRLWIGAANRPAAQRLASARKVELAAAPGCGRRVTSRRPLAPAVPRARGRVPSALRELADRPWSILEGCLVQAVEDADVIAVEWLKAAGGDVALAERSLNRFHLWDALDDEPGGEHDDLAAASALALAWQREIARVPGAEGVVIELTASDGGPELTAYRWDAALPV